VRCRLASRSSAKGHVGQTRRQSKQEDCTHRSSEYWYSIAPDVRLPYRMMCATPRDRQARCASKESRFLPVEILVG